MSLPDFDDMYLDREDFYEQGGDEEPLRETKCRDCRSEEVYWYDVGNRWVLMDYNSGKPHKCNAEHLTALRINAFENLE